MTIQNFGKKRRERKKCNRMGETRKKESERSVNWKCEERMPDEKLVKIKTEKARLCAGLLIWRLSETTHCLHRPSSGQPS